MTSEPRPTRFDEFDFEWESLGLPSQPDGAVSPAAPTSGAARTDWQTVDEWELRFAADTTGYVSDPLTTSFTDLDLSDAQTAIRSAPGWADLDTWSGE